MEMSLNRKNKTRKKIKKKRMKLDDIYYSAAKEWTKQVWVELNHNRTRSEKEKKNQF